MLFPCWPVDPHENGSITRRIHFPQDMSLVQTLCGGVTVVVKGLGAVRLHSCGSPYGGRPAKLPYSH